MKAEWGYIIFFTVFMTMIIAIPLDLSFWATCGICILFFVIAIYADEENKKEEAKKDLIDQALKYYLKNNTIK